jgi:predicted phosphodiesterase|tara:strand:+ start:4868 stop:6070 length:1203 start_codon:yes stop_codon:yes gene_type:complete
MPKKKVKTKKEVPHNEDLGNNYYPSGWKPQRSWDNGSNTGEVTHIQPKTDDFKFNSLLTEWGFDPELYFIEEESIKFSTWDTQLKGGRVEQMYAFKATIRRKKPNHDKFFNDLLKQVKKKNPIKIAKTKGDNAYFFMCSDWQFGKAEYNTDWGVDETVQYIENAIIEAKQNIKDLNKNGVLIDEIYIIGLGDLIENCYGFFDHQAFNVELTRTEQEHIARLMVLKILDGLLALAPKIVIGGVAGNHAEYRSGKAQVATTRLDNSDTTIFQIVGEIIQDRDRYKHVKVVIPDDFYLTLEVKTKRLTFYHGHMAGGGGNAENKLINWWKNQAMARLPSGTADILVTGHYHHLRILMERGRTWIQSPSLDTSYELESRMGLTTSHGILTFTVSNKGWDNLKIL